MQNDPQESYDRILMAKVDDVGRVLAESTAATGQQMRRLLQEAVGEVKQHYEERMQVLELDLFISRDMYKEQSTQAEAARNEVST